MSDNMQKIYYSVFEVINVIPPAIIAAAITVYVTLMINQTQWRIARRKAVVDLVFSHENSTDYRTMNQKFSKLRRNIGLRHLNDPRNENDRQDRQFILDYLNHYELIALGIKSGVLDEKTYREWMLNPFVRDWNAAVEFIQGERWRLEGDEWLYYDRSFANFQTLARRWDRTAFNLTKDSFPPPDSSMAGGPGDEPLPGAPDEQSS